VDIKYRPEGWYKTRGEAKLHSWDNCGCIGCMSYEAGADAMIEGLKKETKPVLLINEEQGTVGMFLPIVTTEILRVITEMAMNNKENFPIKIEHIT